MPVCKFGKNSNLTFSITSAFWSSHRHEKRYFEWSGHWSCWSL